MAKGETKLSRKCPVVLALRAPNALPDSVHDHGNGRSGPRLGWEWALGSEERRVEGAGSLPSARESNGLVVRSSTSVHVSKAL